MRTEDRVRRPAVIRRLARSLITCLMTVGVMLGICVPTSAEVTARHDQAVTLQARLVVGDQLEQGYWITGFASAPGEAPNVVALAWAETSVGWFGSVWGLQLVSAEGLLPPQMATPGQGFLQGTQFYSLSNATPQPGHIYDVTFSFDPQSGAIAVRVFDFTDQRSVLERGLNVRTYDKPFYDSIGYAPTTMQAPAFGLEALDLFVPIGFDWRIVQAGPGGLLQNVDAVDRREETRLTVRSPWQRLPGELHVWLDGGAGRQLLGVVKEIVDQAALPLSFADRVAGEYTVTVQYVTDTGEVSLGTRSVRVGVVHALLESVTVGLVGEREIAIQGDLVVTADGPINTVTVGLDAVLERVGLVPAAQSNQRVFTTEREAVRSVLVRELSSLGQEPVRIPFHTTLHITSELAWPYRIWNTVLQPSVHSAAGGRSTPYQESIRVYTDVPAISGHSVRFMTYNIQHGAGMDDRIDLQRLADVIAYSGAEVIGLQEVDVRTQRSNGVDQARALAELLNMHSAFGSNIPYRGGEYGNAILSRYPIVSANNIRLPSLGGEARGMLHAVVDVEGTPISFYVTHLSLVAEEREMQNQHIVKQLRSTSVPFVLVGDFNFSPARGTDPRQTLDPIVRDAWLEAGRLSPEGSPLRTLTTLGHTFSSANPTRRIDYIFLSDRTDLVGDHGVFIIQTLASDHLPLVAEVHIKD